jgi:photosystem II stability/assembly factor-like uncharacterized protein
MMMLVPRTSKITLVAIIGLLLLPCGRAGQWVALGPFGGDVRSLAHDPRHPDRIFLGTSAGQLYTSGDGATTWSPLAHFGHDGNYVLDNIAVDRADPQTMYVAAWRLDGGGDLFRSRDAGKSWQALLGMHGKSIRALALAPSNPRILIAGALDGVFRSRDGGDNWERISPEGHAELKNIESVAIDPYHPELIYVGTWHLPWKTADGGKSWHSIRNGVIDDSDVFSIIIDRDHPTVVYASACSGIYKSNNTGELFRKVQGIPYSARRTRVLEQDPAHPEIVYAGTTEGLWKTLDGGETWERLTAPSVVINDILIDPRRPERVLLATDRGGVLASNDGGRTFAASNRGFAHRQVTAVAVDQRDAATVYAAVINDKDFGGVFVSRDGGAHWTQLNSGLGGRDVFSLHQAQDGTLLAGTTRGVFALARSAGAWRPINVVLERRPRRARGSGPDWVPVEFNARVAQLEVLSGRWLAATSAGLFTSLDDGQSWHGGPILGEQNLVAIAGSGRMVLAASPRAVLISRDGAANWTRAALPPYITTITEVAVTPESTFWIATAQGAFRSTDTGRTWEHVIAGVPARNLATVAYDAEGRRLLAAAMSSGEIFASTDRGRTWTRAADTGWPVRSLVVARGRLFGATPFDGIVAEIEGAAKDSPRPAAEPGKQ